MSDEFDLDRWECGVGHEVEPVRNCYKKELDIAKQEKCLKIDNKVFDGDISQYIYGEDFCGEFCFPF